MDLERLKQAPFYLSDRELAWVSDTLTSLSTEEKAGQLFCVLGDAETPEGLRELVEQYSVGAVLFRPAPCEEIREKFKKLDCVAKVPLLHAANLEEGGAGAITDGTYFASQLQVAATDDASFAAELALNCALEGRRAGIHWTFSPVADIDLNFRNPITNVRTYGSDPVRVLENVRAYVETIQKYGIAASCKHFPGDGVDYRDQHLHPTYNDLPAEEWFSTCGRIYETLIREGLMSVMVGHIFQPNVIRAVNPAATAADMLPGSLSRELLTGVLRERFGFNGVIITDATIMGGYTMAMEREKAIPASIAAGCDMICFGTDIREDIGYILLGLKSGLLTEERLDEAVARILAMKAWVSRKDIPQPKQDAPHMQRACADRAITLVKDTQDLLPISRERYPHIRLAVLGTDETYDGSLMDMAAQYLTSKGFQVERYDPFADDLHGTKGIPRDRLTLILANLPAQSNQTAVRLTWCPKHAMEIPRFVNEETTAFISFANPYHLQDIPRVRTYINAYTATRATVEAALGKLLGESAFFGIDPVDPFCGLTDTRL